MVSSVYWEWELLLKSIKLGFQLGILYDGLRVFRMIINHSPLFMEIEDVFYWIISTLGIFHLQLVESQGVLRGFSMAGILLAMFFYHKLIAKLWICPVERAIQWGKIRLTKVKKMLRMKGKAWGCILYIFRRGNDKKKDQGSKKKAKSFSHDTGDHGSSGNDAGSGGE